MWFILTIVICSRKLRVFFLSFICESMPEIPPPDASISSISGLYGFHCRSIGELEKADLTSLNEFRALSSNSIFYFASFFRRLVIPDPHLKY